MKFVGGIILNDLCQLLKNVLVQCIFNRYKNNVDDVIENDDVVKKMIVMFGSKYLLKVK